MPQTRTSPDGKASEPKREVRSELGWKLAQQTQFDGLSPSQIVRVLNAADRGLEGDDFAAIAARLDATPDADNRANSENVTTDARRYVADPYIEKHTFKGLWTGGPVVVSEQGGHKTLRQTLTRTFCAGHGYSVNGATGAVSITSGGTGAAAALKKHRPAVRRIFQSRMAFDPKIPGSYRTELVWRDFTHESFAHLESLSLAEVKSAIASHAGLANAANAISETNCQIDPQTNTVVFTAAGVFKDTTAPTSITQLLKAPMLEGPCTRDTLRAYGMNSLADGEGYRYTHQYRFLDLEDTDAVRKFLEITVKDSTLLPKLLKLEYAAESPSLVSTAKDKQGRFYTRVSGFSGDAARIPWYRIAQKRVDKQEEDGLISFTVIVQKPEWHGADVKGARRTVSQQNMNGPGKAIETVIPSVHREAAEQIVENAKADDGLVIAAATISDGEGGSADVRLHQAPEWKFDGSKGGDPPRVLASFDKLSVKATSLRHTDTATESAWDAHFENLAPERVTALVTEVSNKIIALGKTKNPGAITFKGIAQAPNGTYTVDIHAEGVEKKVYAEWVATATHTSETREQVKYNVPQDELTSGGIDPATHAIVRENRSLNKDGSWNEQITRVLPVKCTLTFGSVSGHVTSRHTIYRNADALPEGLSEKAPTLQGSASHNEHGLIDAQTVDTDDDKVVQVSTGGDHFSTTRSVTQTTPDPPTAVAGVNNGTITEVSDTTYPDGYHRSQVSTRTANPCSEIAYVTQSGHAAPVTHHRATNVLEIPGKLTGAAGDGLNIEGSAQHNAFGLVDAQWSEQAKKDESREAVSKNYYGSQRSTTRTAQDGSATAEQTTNHVVSVTQDTLPDGFVRETVNTEDFTPRNETFYTQEGDRHHVRVVDHHVFRNLTELPTALTKTTVAEGDTNRYGGSADRNAHGSYDGHWTHYDALAEDDKGASLSEDRFSVRKGDSEVLRQSRMAEAETFTEGQVVTVDETTFPDGAVSSRKTVEIGKEADYDYEEEEINQSTRETRTLHHYVYRNSKDGAEAPRPGTDEHVLRVQKELNRFGMWDLHYVVGPHWKTVAETVETRETHNLKTVSGTVFVEKGHTDEREKPEYNKSGDGFRRDVTVKHLEDGSRELHYSETTAKNQHHYFYKVRQKSGKKSRVNTVHVYHNVRDNDVAAIENAAMDDTDVVEFTKQCGDLDLWSISYKQQGEWVGGKEHIDDVEDQLYHHIETTVETTQHRMNDGTLEYAAKTAADGYFWRVCAREIEEGVNDGEIKSYTRYKKSNRYPGGSIRTVSDKNGNPIYWTWKTVRQQTYGTEGWLDTRMTSDALAKETKAAMSKIKS